jgi:hypothetical protein
MSNKATLALAAMAAERENPPRPGYVPSEESVAAIDDILSLAKNMEFYGRKTKTYTNSRDEKSGSYCTIPVKYEFESKDIRIEAETFLRKHCGAHCSTPYPATLRECVKQTIDAVKKDFPDCQVKVLVDTDNFCLKVAKRRMVDGKGEGRWDYYSDNISLPPEALNVELRKVPDGFKLANVPVKRSRHSGSEEMVSSSPPP